MRGDIKMGKSTIDIEALAGAIKEVTGCEHLKGNTSPRYDQTHVVRTTKQVELFVCPECSFSYHAFHEVKDDQGGFICYRCETSNQV